jgi:hypothetical protein
MYLQLSAPGTRTPQASDAWVGLSGVRGMLLFVAFPWRGTTEPQGSLRFGVLSRSRTSDSDPPASGEFAGVLTFRDSWRPPVGLCACPEAT